jgi:hypothetical protein
MLGGVQRQQLDFVDPLLWPGPRVREPFAVARGRPASEAS